MADQIAISKNCLRKELFVRSGL